MYTSLYILPILFIPFWRSQGSGDLHEGESNQTCPGKGTHLKDKGSK